MMRLLLLVAALTLAAAPAFAVSGAGKAAADRWHSADECTKKSFELFPDWTKEHAAKRDAYVRKCLAEKRLPQRDTIAPKG
jgi:hypothetical protein